jgi:ribonuclease HI
LSLWSRGSKGQWLPYSTELHSDDLLLSLRRCLSVVPTRAVYKRFPTRNAAQEYMSGSSSSTVEVVKDNFRPETASARSKPTSTAVIAHDPASQDLDHHRQVARSQGFTITSGPTGALVVYTDGSSRGNGQLGATAGSGIWWADKGHARTL